MLGGQEGQEVAVSPGAEATGTAEASATEKTEEQQKIEALVNQVREVNAQLGGKVAAEVGFDSGRSTFFFARSRRNPYNPLSGTIHAYGVDSVQGPVWFTGELPEKFPRRDGVFSVDFEKMPKVTEDDVNNWVHPIAAGGDMDLSSKSFELSKDAVLQDQQEMERIRAERNRTLDQALSVVSKPIDLSTPPSTLTSA